MEIITHNNLPEAVGKICQRLDDIEALLRKEKNPRQSKEEFITRQETASFLGISLPTLNDWTKRGLIPAYRIATRVRYKKEDIIQALNKVQAVKYGRGNNFLGNGK